MSKRIPEKESDIVIELLTLIKDERKVKELTTLLQLPCGVQSGCFLVVNEEKYSVSPDDMMSTLYDRLRRIRDRIEYYETIYKVAV